MIEQVDIGTVLFLDIETVSGKPSFTELSKTFQDLWAIKSRQITRRYDEELEPEELAEIYTEKAGIYAEFGKIVCISVGFVRKDQKDKRFRIRLKSFASDNEAELLTAFSNLIEQYYNNTQKSFLCGHNIREFDIPYICRRIVANQLPLPNALNLAGKKPWETKHLLDTLELWKFGDYKNYTSLKLLAAVLDFPSPKDDIDGSNVGRTYWVEQDLPRIAHYCEKDVLATAQLFLRYQRKPLFEEDQVIHVGQ